MDSSLTGWRPLMRRQWPLTLALVLMLLVEFTSGYSPTRPLALLTLSGAVLALLAVIAPRRPVDSTLLAAAGMLATTVVLEVVDAKTYGVVSGMSPTETAAGMALIATVVKQAKPARSAVATGLLVLSAIIAGTVRPANVHLFDSLNQIAIPGILLLLSIGTGLYFRARDLDRKRSVTSAVSAAQQDERLALARELHDVVAHHVTGIVVQAQAAQVVAEQNPHAAQQVLPSIEKAGLEALTAMRGLVGNLREADQAGAGDAAAAGTMDAAADVAKVVADARTSGMPVELSLDLPSTVPPELARSVLRVVQESLTNSRKHALRASVVRVSVSTGDDIVHVKVADDGHGSSSAPIGGSGGYGLVGMRERVELLGGRFTAGPGRDGGWEVHAWLPLREARQ